MLARPVTLTVDAVTRMARTQRLPEPHITIAGETVWRSPDLERDAETGALAEFRRHGLADDRGPLPDAHELLTLLTRPPVEYYGWFTVDGTTTGVLVTARRPTSSHALVASTVDDEVRLVSVRNDGLAATLVNQLPPASAARGEAISLRQAELGPARPGAAPGLQGFLTGSTTTLPHAARRLRALLDQPIQSHGQLKVAVRDQHGARHTAEHPISFLDTPHGRWFSQLDTRQREPWVVVAPATPQTLTTRLTELHRALAH